MDGWEGAMSVCAPFDICMYAPMLGGSSKKRKHGDRVFGFKTFCTPGNPTHFGASFQENVRALLELGTRENDLIGGARRWSFILELHRQPPIHVSLYVMEEFIDEKCSHRHCHYCRCIGWGHHVICNRMFHFVLPSRKATLLKEAHGSNGYVPNGAGSTDAKAFLMMNLQSQLMHGILHSNGFGHLLCINGIEGGSEIVSGYQIMELWDRICSGLRTRKVSLTDTARKGTMSLRLIHGIGYGEPWFGTWGYQFGRGSFGVTRDMYCNSVEILQSLPLCLIVPQYGSIRHEIPAIVAKYQVISGNSLFTLGHLLKFMQGLKRRLPLDTLMALDYHGIATEPACRWSIKRVEMAAQVIVDTLKKAGPRWVSRQDVRDSARSYVGDTGLLDFVLKSIGNHVVGNYMVRRMVNPVTKVLEYCLYKYVLKEQNPAIVTGIFDTVPMAVRIILDSKHLVKDYGCVSLEFMDDSIRVICSIHLGLASFVVESIVGIDGNRDTDLLLSHIESGSSIVISGRIQGVADTSSILEGSSVAMVVDCQCGTKEEDGERMICCDVCEVWQHTRCIGIPNSEDPPTIFLCRHCEQDISAIASLMP